jgi:hypothetical protein
MSHRTVSANLCLLAFALSTSMAFSRSQAADEKGTANSVAVFDRFKELKGEWVGKAPQGGAELHLIFNITSGGSVVTETMFPGTPHEMLNVIHPDGSHIVLTHYCAMGNQPEMKAPDKIDGKQVPFIFSRAGNLKSPTDPHMHNVTYTFVDKDTLRTRWTTYADGKPAGDIVTEVKRKK